MVTDLWLATVRDIFGASAVIPVNDGVEIDGTHFPIVDDVLVALPSDRRPRSVRRRITGTATASCDSTAPYASDIQSTFGAEWQAYPRILPEHHGEFNEYFDLIDLPSLRESRVADLGCGIGRWSYFLAPFCKEIILVDYSDAIFVARDNLRSVSNVVFIMADVLDLPFRDNAFDFAFCLGVLHHLPVDALAAARALSSLSPQHLFYLYYALDNRPAYYRPLLRIVTTVRRALSEVHNDSVRRSLSWLIALAVYRPLIGLGLLLRRVGREQYIPLTQTYSGKSLTRLRQDVYDRFFTRIEQRFTRLDILALRDTFATVELSAGLPYWHFRCSRTLDHDGPNDRPLDR